MSTQHINIEVAYDKFDYLQMQVKQLKSTVKDTKQSLTETETEIDILIKTSDLLTLVSKQAKAFIIEFVEQFVSEALTGIYEEPNFLKVELEFRRGTYETDFYLEDEFGKVRIKPPFIGKGGGKITVTAMLIRLAIIELSHVKGPIFMDEATKMVDKNAIKNVCVFLADYSEKFNRDVIAVTHQKALMEASNIAYEVVKTKGISKVKEVKYG